MRTTRTPQEEQALLSAFRDAVEANIALWGKIRDLELVAGGDLAISETIENYAVGFDPGGTVADLGDPAAVLKAIDDSRE